MRSYQEIGYQGICRPDHVPTMGDDNNENYGYSEIGDFLNRLYQRVRKQFMDLN